MWMFAVAIAVGNAFILKPSEKDPSVPVRLAELFLEAGGPPGILNVVNGGKAAVDAILDPSGHRRGELRRLVRHRRLRLRHRRRAREAGAGDGRGQEPRRHPARRRPRPGGAGHRRRGLRLGRRALHGPAGGRAGGRARPPRRCARSCWPRSRRCRSASPPTPTPSTARWSPPRTRSGSRTTSSWARTKAPNWCWTAAASRCRATRRASSSARPCSTRSSRR